MNTRVKTLFVVLTILVLAALQFAAAGASGGDPEPGGVGVMRASFAQDFPTPPSSITSALANVPPDAAGIPTQGNIDLNSWLTFIALNWPADTSKCGPNTGATILSGSGPTVWETYLSDADVFVAPGSKPSPWCPQTSGSPTSAQLSRLPAAARRLAQQSGARTVFFRLSKGSAEVKGKLRAGAGRGKASPAAQANQNSLTGIEEAVGGVLTDQNGRFVRYEVRLNQDEYNYLTQNNLWNRKGQDYFTNTLKKTITFPIGQISTGAIGAIEIKAAWKVLSASEIAGKRFYAIKAVIFNNEKNQNPSVATLGLVGMHITHKTQTQPKWIWSTFEHVDNLRPPPGSPFGAKASFTNPDCPPATCPPNVQTAKQPYTELGPNGQPLNKPVQVTRVNPVGDENVNQLNQTFRGLLQGSVWANYQLISAQWVGELGSLPKPPFLANTVIETFNQTPSPPSDGPYPFPSPQYNPFAAGVTSSCMKCHSVAVTASALANGQTQPKADFSFIMGNAQ